MMATWQFADVGFVALILGLVIAVYTMGAALFGTLKKRPEFLASARNGIFVLAGLTTLAVGILEFALITGEFRLEYVANHVSRAQPLLYTISALWGGQEGSLLFWVWLLSLFAAISIVQNREQNRALIPYVISFLALTEGFFFVLLIFTSSPFKLLDSAPLDGQGLNPLLQNPGMFIHPITQYMGYVGFAVPFAFALAALVTGKLNDVWIRTTRRWALFSWIFLSLGLFFGMRWAYVELGWGGYWGWDPVENAALIPWLTGTAYLHSIMIQEKRGMLKVWNLVLVMLTFILSILGTFLTRSGVVQSVHAFGVSTLGPYFLGFMGLVLVAFLYLLYTRLDLLHEENEMESIISREATFLLNNLLLIGLAFATLWGTIFPMISEVFTGKQISVAAPFFDQVNGPIFFALIVLLGLCTLIGWRRASTENLVRNFRWPVLMSVVAIAALVVVGIRDAFGLMGFGAGLFVLSTVVFEFYRGIATRSRQYKEILPIAGYKLVNKNRRRYGGYIVHLGIVLAVIGIVGSTFYQTDIQQNLKPGETVQIGDYTLRFDQLNMVQGENSQRITSSIAVLQGGQQIATMHPAKAYYPAADQMTSEVDVRTTAREDLYLILAGWADDGSATIKAIINPLVVWLWIGFIVFVLGTVITMLPDQSEARQLARIQAQETLAGAKV
ncbi:MAG: heme lyase CcmF/NrfE family subunit [Anaerolineae bacterium]